MSTTNNNYDFLITGVGGQGTVLVSNVLAEVGMQAGYDVKKTEVHGMAQRGGSVTTHVRWGQSIFSPVIGQGEAGILLSLEKLEALRYLSMLRPGGLALIGDSVIPPLTVSSGSDVYPSDEQILAVFRQVTERVYFTPTMTIAKQLGNSRVHNVVLLGALSNDFPDIDPQIWLDVIAERVPAKHVELNKKAFQEGRIRVPGS